MKETWLTESPIAKNVQARERLEADTEAFLAAGGEITEIPKGRSAWNENDIAFMQRKMRSSPTSKAVKSKPK